MSQAQSSPLVNLPSEIQRALTLDLESSRELLQLLQAEQAAMENRDRHTLSDIVNSKSDCMNRLETQAGKRYQILEALDRPVNESAWKDLIEEQNEPSIQHAWSDLINTLEQCRHHNEVNGRLINRGQQSLHYLLSVIRGQVNPPSLYNQRGATESQQNGHTVTRA